MVTSYSVLYYYGRAVLMSMEEDKKLLEDMDAVWA